jgi:hypothetical protein
MKMLAAIIAMTIAFAAPVAASAQCYQVNFASFGANLNEDLTEAQVVQAVGYQPTTVSLETCGYDTKKGSWQCKIYTYGAPCSGELKVLFYKSNSGAWLVNNWTTTLPTGF